MKIVKARLTQCFLSDQDIPTKLDMQVLEIRCPQCGFNLHLPEASVTNHTAEQVNVMWREWNRAMEDVTNACEEVYGEDPRLFRLIGLLEALKKRFLKADLKVIHGGKKGGGA